VHVQSLLGDRPKTRSARRIANLRLEFETLRLERRASSIEIAQSSRLADTVRSSSYDARSHQDETEQHECHHRPP